MRCKICDYSPSNPSSTYRDSLCFPSGQNNVNMVVYNKETGTYGCPLCAPDELELRDYPDIIEEIHEIDDSFDEVHLLEEDFDDVTR